MAPGYCWQTSFKLTQQMILLIRRWLIFRSLYLLNKLTLNLWNSQDNYTIRGSNSYQSNFIVNLKLRMQGIHKPATKSEILCIIFFGLNNNLFASFEYKHWFSNGINNDPTCAINRYEHPVLKSLIFWTLVCGLHVWRFFNFISSKVHLWGFGFYFWIRHFFRFSFWRFIPIAEAKITYTYILMRVFNNFEWFAWVSCIEQNNLTMMISK